MPAPVEIEIKLAANPAAMMALSAQPALAGADRTATLYTSWFDTADRRLQSQGAMLRVRESNNGFEQTLKLAGPTGSRVRRLEWNGAVPGADPEPALLPPTARQRLAELIGDQTLVPLGTARVERRERDVVFGSSTLAVAFDSGTIDAGGESRPVSEVELEVVAGSLADALRLALQLPLGPDLYWSARSKSERGAALVQGVHLPAVGARSPCLRADMSAVVALHALAWNALEHLLANYSLVIVDGSPEGVHQTRIALRRLRVALKLFRPIPKDCPSRVLRAALGTVSRSIAPARALYVLRMKLAEAADAAGIDAPALFAHLDARLLHETLSARDVQVSTEFQRLLFETALWAEEGGRTSHHHAAAKPPSLRKIGADALDRIHRDLRHRHCRLAKIPEEQRHRIRLDAKHLRYATGFLESAWPHARGRRKFARALASLQDSLGELNDHAERLRLREYLLQSVEPSQSARIADEFDAILALLAEPDHTALTDAQRAFDWLVKAEPWWR